MPTKATSIFDLTHNSSDLVNMITAITFTVTQDRDMRITTSFSICSSKIFCTGP